MENPCMWNFTEVGMIIISAVFLKSEIVNELHCWGLGVGACDRQKY